MNERCSGGSRISPMRKRQPKGGGVANLLFGQIFAENWMKMKEVGWGGGTPLAPPLDPPMQPGYLVLCVMVSPYWLSLGLGPSHGWKGCMLLCRTFHTAPEQGWGLTPVVPHCSGSSPGPCPGTGHNQCYTTNRTCERVEAPT